MIRISDVLCLKTTSLLYCAGRGSILLSFAAFCGMIKMR